MANLKEYLTVTNIIALILIIVGLIWGIWGVWRNWKSNRINKKWEKTNALVESSYAQPVNDAAGNTYVDPRNIRPTVDSEARYKPVVTYRYRVDGKDHQSNNVVFADHKEYSPVEIKTLLNNIYQGSVIPIYYNPRDPSEAYIFPGESKWVGPIIALILLLVGLWIGSTSFAKSKKKVESKYDPRLTEFDTPVDDRTGVTYTINRNNYPASGTRPSSYRNRVF